MFLDDIKSRAYICAKPLVSSRLFIYVGGTSKSLRKKIVILQTAPYIMGKAESSLIRAPKTSW